MFVLGDANWTGDFAVEEGAMLPFDITINQLDGGGSSIYWGTWSDGTGAGGVTGFGTLDVVGSGGTMLMNGDNTQMAWNINDAIQLNGDATLIASVGGVTINNAGDAIYGFGADRTFTIQVTDGQTIAITADGFGDNGGADFNVSDLTIETLGGGGDITATLSMSGDISGGLSVDANTGISLDTLGATFTADKGMRFNDAVTLTGAASLITDGGAGSDILFDSTITGAQTLTLDTGAGGSTTFSGDVTIDDLTVTGATNIDGDRGITIANAAVFNGTIGGGNLTLSGATVGFNGNVAALASIDVTGVTTIAAGVNFDTVDDITFNSAVTVNGVSDLSTGVGGAITFVSTLDGAAADVTLNSGAGGVSFGDDVGGGAMLSSLDVTGVTSIADGISIAASGSIDFHSAVVVTGSATIASALNDVTLDSTVTGDTTGTLNVTGLGNVTIVGLTSDFTDVTVVGVGITTVAGVEVSGDIAVSGTAGITLTGADYTTTAGGVTFTGAVSLANNDVTITSGGGAGDDILFTSTIDADDATNFDRMLTLDSGDSGDIAVTGVVGGAEALAGLTITNSNDTIFAQAVTVTDGVGAVVISDTEVGTAVVFNGFLTAHSFTASTSDSAYDVEMNLGASITNASVFDNTGQVILVDGGNDFEFDGGMAINDADSFLSGDFITNNADINFGTGAATLTGDTTISTGAGIGTITFGGTLDDDGVVERSLILTAGTGDIDFDGAVGATAANTELGAVTINSANNVTVDSTFEAFSFAQVAGTGTTTLDGAMTTTDVNGVNIATDSIAVNAGINTTTGAGVVVLNASDTLTIAAAGDINSGDVVTLTATNGIATAGDITSADTVTFVSETVLTGDVSITANGGNIIFSDTLDTDAGENLTLTAVAGDINFNGAVGSDVVSDLGAILINNATNVTAVSIDAESFTQGSGTGTTTFGGAVNTTGAAGVNVTTAGIALNNTIDTANGGTVTLTADTNAVTIAAGGDITSDGAVTLTGTTGISTAGDITTTDDDVTFASATVLTGAVAIDSGATGGDIAFNGNVTGAENLTLDAGTAGAITAGLMTVNDLTITDAASLSVTGNLTANDLITTNGTATTVSLTGSANSFVNQVDFLNSGNVILGDGGGDTFLFTGGLAFTGGSTNNLDSAISSVGTDINFGVGGTTLDGNTSVSTGAGAGTITFGGTLDGLAGGENLTLTAGTGNIDFDGVVGATRLGDVLVNSVATMTADQAFNAASFEQTAGSVATTFTGALDVTNGVTITDGTDVTFASTVNAATVSQVAGSGTTTFGGAVTTSGAAGVNVTNDAIALNASIVATTGTVDLTADTNAVTIAAAGDITADGIVNLTGATGINTAGDVTTSGFGVNYNSATVLSGNVAVNTGAGAGAITFANILDGTVVATETLTLTAGTGNITFNGNVGGAIGLGTTTVASANNVTTTGLLSADSIGITATGLTSLGGITEANNAINIASGAITTAATTVQSLAGDITLDANTGALTLANGTTVQTASGSIALTGTTGINMGANVFTGGAVGTISITGDVTMTQNVTVDSSLVTVGGAGDITMTGNVDGAFDLTLDAEGDLTMTGNVGATTALGNLTGTTTGDTTVTGTVDTTADINLVALGDVTLGGDLTAGGDVLLVTGSVGTIAFGANVSNVTSGGDIRLTNTAVSGTSVPTIATITSENVNGITFDAGDDFVMSAGEKLTAYDIDIQTGRLSGNGRAVLGDLTAIGDIRVTADDIDFISRDTGRVLTSNGTFVRDNGVDVVAGGRFFFSVAPTMINGNRPVQFASNTIDSDANGTLSDWIVRWSPTDVTVNSLTLGTTILDLRADGIDSLTVEELGALSGALTPMSQMVPIVRIHDDSEDDSEFETDEDTSQEASVQF